MALQVIGHRVGNGNMQLSDAFKKILSEYPVAVTQPFLANLVAAFVRKELPESIRNFAQITSDYLIERSAGQGQCLTTGNRKESNHQTKGISVSTPEPHLGSGVHPFLDDLELLRALPYGHLGANVFIAAKRRAMPQRLNNRAQRLPRQQRLPLTALPFFGQCPGFLSKFWQRFYTFRPN